MGACAAPRSVPAQFSAAASLADGTDGGGPGRLGGAYAAKPAAGTSASVTAVSNATRMVRIAAIRGRRLMAGSHQRAARFKPA
jgi:hypothetical protein